MFRVEVEGVARKRAQLADFIENIGDMGPLWEAYGEIMAKTEKDWFASEGDGLWPPLARSTVRDKEQHGWPPETLVRTGALLESLTNPAQAMGVGQGRSTLGTFTRNSMTWGTDVTDDRGREYAHYHQGVSAVTGEPVSYGGQPPQRQPIPWPLPPHTRGEMAVADEIFVDECVRRSGLA